MADVFLALMRTLGSLRDGKVWTYVLVPALFSLCLTLGLAFWALGALVEQILDYPPLTLFISWGMVWLAHFLAYIGGWMAIFAVAYLTASLLAAVVVLPLLLKHLSKTQYADLATQGADNFVASTVNSLLAALLFIVGWVMTLPLWVIPGLSLILPMLLMAGLNRRTFAYDALSMHATDEEWRVIRQKYKGPLFMLGLIMALLAHIPIIGLFVPALAALAFVHFGLEVLRQERGDGTIVGEAVRVVNDDDNLRLN